MVTGKPHTWASHPRQRFPAAQHNGLFPRLLHLASLYITATFLAGDVLAIFLPPYHRQTSSPRPGHTPSSSIKRSRLKGPGHVSLGPHDSLTFGFSLCERPLHPSLAWLFFYSLMSSHNTLGFDLVWLTLQFSLQTEPCQKSTCRNNIYHNHPLC